MASDTFKRLMFALIIGAVFATLITFTAVQMGANYGRSSNEIGGGALDDSNFQTSIEDVDSQAEGYRATFEGGNPIDVDDASGLFSILSSLVNMITEPFELIAEVMENILGVPQIVTNVVLGLFSLALIFGFWSLIKKGD